MMAASRVWIQPRPKPAKIRLLWPFLSHYRRQRPLLGLPPALYPLVLLARVSRDGGIVLIKNPKAATSTLESRMLQWRAGEETGGDMWDAEEDPQVAQDSWRSTAKVVAALNNPDSRVVSFVRDPYRRFTSAFMNFLVDQRNRRFPRHLRYLTAMGYRPDADTARNFDIFLDYVAACIEADAAYTDPHFRPQVLNLRQDLIDYAFIGRVETLTDDLARLEALLGVQGKGPPQAVAARNVSSGRYEPTPAQRQRIRDLYAADFEAFGYPD